MIRDDASESQVQASNPAFSTWLSANAGSGKTRVLTDRVARLLLSGVQPQHVLCLTYTKAAAREMQNRLFDRLGEWAMKPDDALMTALTELGDEGRFAPGALAKARQLFARAIETPGGLRIQTIHSFCATLLRRFPLESGVSPQFTEIDDRTTQKIIAQIAEEIAETVAPDLMFEVAQRYSGADFSTLLGEIAKHRAAFAVQKSDADIRKLFGLPAGESIELILADVFLGGEADLCAAIDPIMRAGSVTDAKNANILTALDMTRPNMTTLSVLETVFLSGDKAEPPFAAKVDTLPTKPTRLNMGALIDPLNAFMRRVESAHLRRLALFAAQKTVLLHRLAAVFLPRYAAAKAARGFLDFDDLITQARALLTNPDVAAWVLFRLDGGIDHILVDEAQDTSPAQWDVIEMLSAEFTAGVGAHAGGRTLFVVGDKKQSIFSFQGADVAAFDEKWHRFKSKFEAAGQAFQTAELRHSFRSSQAILRVVDEVFGSRFPAAMGDQVAHIAFKDAMPGRVDLWPLIEKVPPQKDENWEDPIDLISETHHMARLADRIAAEIASMIAAGTQIPDGLAGNSRPVHAGDFLILVQNRRGVFDEIIRACKQANLPIAGADRLKLGGEIAVRDLVALLSFLATPEDDLSLAAFLRSPLAGWTEAELYTIAQPRTGYLWEALRSHHAHPTVEMLTDLRDQTDYLRPYDLLERVLIRHDGRRRLLARLGPEAEDGIDELLSQAIAFETSEIPSLTGFLMWLASDEIIVKRQMDSAGGRIRVMTVHGAKGLEAPIVILPDTCNHTHPDRNEVYAAAGDVPIWKTNTDQDTPNIAQARTMRAQKADEERLRLLYVALTRARSWLIVAGAGEAKQDDCWYRLIAQGMEAAGAIDLIDATKRFSFGDWPNDAPQNANIPLLEPVLQGWVTQNAADIPHTDALISPSALGGEKVLQGEYGDDALDGPAAAARGTALHLLLEYLPTQTQQDWPRIAARLIPDTALCSDVFAEAGGLLTNPDLVSIFSPTALTEVGITAPLLAGQMLGSIDRLIVSDSTVLAVDFKSNRIVPNAVSAVPEGLLRQMGAYASALENLYPNHRIQTAILWTATAQLMHLDRDMLRTALDRATAS